METVRHSAILRLFWQSSLHYPVATFLVLSGVVATNVLHLVSPWYLKRLVDLLTLGPESAAVVNGVAFAIAMIIFLDFAQQVCWRFIGFSSTYLQSRVMVDLSDVAFRKTVRHSHHFFVNTFAGSLVRKINRLSSSYEELADQATYAIIPLVITVVGTIIGISLRNPLIAFIVVGWVILFLGAQYAFSRWKQPAEDARAAADTEATGALADAITNTSTIRLFGGTTYEVERFAETLKRWRRAIERAWKLNEYGFAAQAFSMAAVWAVILWIALRQWQAGQLTAGDFILLHTYLNALFHQLWDISRVFRRYYSAMANAAEIVEVMEATPDVLDAPTAKPMRVTDGRIVFRDVSFHYHHTRPVLSALNLTIEPGMRVALVGPSGAGKTTVTHLLLRLYDVSSGHISIDGQDIARVTQESLRNAISYVPQDPVLFHRSLMENIRYGRRDATDEEVIAAATRARCHEFITSLPQGYETFVGERGIRLSGGERQRVAIARAILKNAPLLVLDEATSSLDSESESLIQEALRELMQGKTTIVIAHRLSTIMEMDRIIVIENGTVTASGTHHDLQAMPGTYKTLWDIQAGGFIP